MRRSLSITLAVAALLNLLPGLTAAQGPQGGQAAPAASGGGTTTQPAQPAQPVPRAEKKTEHKQKAKAEVKPAAANSVTVKDFSFGPSSITIHVGDTVTWVNNGPTEHTATASNGSFDTGTLKKGQSGSHTFDSAGTFSYICSLHPFMKGTVVVAAAAGTSSPSASSTPSTAAPSASPREGVTPQSGGLPNTGVDVVPLLLSGLLLLASGLLLRRHLT